MAKVQVSMVLPRPLVAHVKEIAKAEGASFGGTIEALVLKGLLLQTLNKRRSDE